MQTGIVSNENLAEILREVSQKRKHGILEIIFPDETVTISFVSGKIVEYASSLENPIQDLLLRLQLCGLISTSHKFNCESYQEMFEAFANQSDKNLIEADFFKTLVKERVLDHLYKLQLGAGVYYNFKVQMVKPEDFSPSISVGQLLLDLVALKDESELFNKQFSDDSILKATQSVEHEDPSEQWLANYLNSAQKLSDFKNIQPFSILKFQELVASMFQKGYLELQDVVDATDVGSTAMLDDIVSALEGALDSKIMPFGTKQEDLSEVSQLEESLSSSIIPAKVEKRNEPEVVTNKTPFLQNLNTELLQNSLVPNVLSLLFILAAIYAPFIAWKEVVRIFSEF